MIQNELFVLLISPCELIFVLLIVNLNNMIYVD